MIIKDRIKNMLTELGINPSDDTHALEMSNQLMDHFNKIIIETLIIRLNDEQLVRFKNYMDMDTDEELDTHITQLASEIPGLQFKIEEAIQAEFETLKAAKAIIDK